MKQPFVGGLIGRAMLLTCLLAVALAGSGWAQTSTGTIRGRVVDEAGTPVAAANVVATNISSGFQRGAITRTDGFYLLPGLQPGTYQLQVSSLGFSPQTDTLRVLIGQSLTANLQLTTQAVELAGITVVGNRGVETQTSEVATNVTQEQIESLPQNSRNFLNFAQLAPGVQLSTNEERKTFSSGGLPAENVNVFIDGASFKNDILQGGVAGQDASRGNPFPQNAIQEFRVLTQNYKAEYQKASGAIITATTKSGGNTFEGGAFVYGQPNEFVDEDFFAIRRCEEARQNDQSCAPKPDYRRYQVGASLGGPIIRDKLHFFGSYEGNYQDRSNTVFLGGAASEFPSDQFRQFAGEFGQPFRSNLFFGKLSYQPTTNQNVEVSANIRTESEDRDFGGQTSFQSATHLTNDVYTFIGKHNYSMGRWLNEVTGSFQRYSWQTAALNPGLIGREYIGVIRIGGKDTDQNFTQDRFSIRDDVTFSGLQLAGDHVFKGGINLDFLRYDVQKEQFGNPLFKFRPDLGMDTPFEAVYGVGNPDLSSDNFQFGIYVQDDWAPTPRLLLNLGIRWDYESDMLNNDYVTPTEVRTALSPFIPSNYFTDGDDRPPFYGAIQPRVGASYDVFGDGRTTIFGGFGIFYDRTFYNAILDEQYRLQYGVRTFRFSETGEPREGQPTIAFRPEYLTPEGLDQLIASGQAPRPEVFLLNNDTRPPHSNQWSAGVRQTVSDWLLSATYTGVRGYDLLTYVRANRQVDPAAPNAFPFRGPCCRDLADQYGAVFVNAAKRTWYNALFLKADRPFTDQSRWGTSVAYTLAKATQSGRDLFSLDKPTPEDYGRYPSPGDQRHTIVASGIVGLPYQFRLSTLVSLGSGGAYTIVDASEGFGVNEISFRGAYPEKQSFILPDAFASRQVDLRLEKNVILGPGQRVGVVGEVFNVFNFDNFGCFTDFLPPEGNPNLGNPNCTVGFPRRFQLGLTYDF